MNTSRRASMRLAVLVVLGVLWLSASFLGGYLLGHADAYAGRPGVSEVAMQAAQQVGLKLPVSVSTAATTLSPDQQARFKIFWEAWNLVDREFYYRDAIDAQRMTYGAVKGMVESLEDPHTAFSTPREKELTDASLRGTFDGIGVQIDHRDGQIRIVAPIEGSPAEGAGLRAGDVIVRVDDKDLRRLALNDVVLLIRGPRGSTVTLTLAREGEPAPLVVPITRAEIKVDNVRSRMLEGDLGYVRINSFNQSAAEDTKVAVKKLMDQNARALVLDLRSNPGGFLHAAVDVTSQFLGDGVVLYQQATNGNRHEYRAKPGGLATGLPIVVLIDKGSASASEIVAAALRDNGRATLIGEKSYGKGSVQSVHSLSDASGIRVTSAIWLTPAGQPLEKNGLEPDQAVASQIDPQSDVDPALEAAIRYLRAGAAAQGPTGV